MATIAEMEGIVAGILASVREGEEARKKNEQELAELRRKNEQELAELRKKNDLDLAELRRKADAAKEKRDQELAELRKEVDAAHKEAERSFNQLNKSINHWVGRLGNTTGYLTEMIIVPGIRPQMAKHGHKFDSLSARKEFFRKDGSAFTEVDLILENGKEAMIVEIKTHLTKEDVKYHLKRLELLRKGEKEAKMTGKSIISGVAGLIIDNSAKELADNRGMYVIRINENEESIKVEAPKKGVGRW